MEKLKKNKEKIFMIVAVIILFIAVIGVSYAAFSYTRTGEKLNAITTGVIRMSYEESSKNLESDLIKLNIKDMFEKSKKE